MTRVAGQEGNTDSIIHLALVSPTIVAQSRWDVLGNHSWYRFPCIILIKKYRTWKHVEKTRAIEYVINWQDTISKIKHKVKPLV